MMKIYIKIKVLMILLAALAGMNVSYSQNNKLIYFVDEDGVHLRWKGERTVDLEGYNIYRQDGGSTLWIKLNQEALTMITDRNEIEALAGYQTAFYLKLYGIEDETSDITPAAYAILLNDPGSVTFMEVMCLVNPELGELLGEMYLDETVVEGEEYKYKVEAIVGSRIIEIGNTPLISISDINEVPSVTGLMGEGNDRSALLIWDKDNELMERGDVVTYRVYRSNTLLGPYAQQNFYGILPITVTSGDLITGEHTMDFNDRYLENGTTYYYQVRAVNAFGIESRAGITLEITPGSDIEPSSPTNLRAYELGKGIMIEWDDFSSFVQGYEIYKSETNTNDFTRVYPKSDLIFDDSRSWIDLRPKEGGHHYYYVVSLNNDLRSDPSDTLHFYIPDQTPPPAPEGVKAEIVEEGFKISWIFSPDDDLLGYEIERTSDDEFKTPLLLNSSPHIDTVFMDTISKKSQTTYGYLLYAVDRSYNRSLPSEMVKAKMPDIVPPLPPILTGLEQNGAIVILSMTENIENDFSVYKLYSSVDGAAFKLLGEIPDNMIQLEMENSGQYRFRATAVDQTGNESEYSNILTFTYDAHEYPDTPRNARITKTEEGHIEISWDTSNDETVEGYFITRTIKETGKVHDIAQLDASQTSFVDKYVKEGSTYSYEVRSRNANWNLSVPATIELKLEE